jgi:hypothetical protein
MTFDAAHFCQCRPRIEFDGFFVSTASAAFVHRSACIRIAMHPDRRVQDGRVQDRRAQACR